MTNLRLLPPFEAFYDLNGEPLSGGKLFFYISGSVTPQNTFYDTDLAPGHENSNPIILDAAGRVTTDIYAPLNTAYKIVLTNSVNSTIRTADPVEVSGTSFDPEGAGLFEIINNNLYPLLPPVISASASITYDNDNWGTATIRTNAGAMTDTLPAPSGSDFPAGWFADYVCLGASLVISASANINGSATLTLGTNDFARIISTGATYYAEVTNGGNLAARPGGTLTIATGAITVGNFAQYLVDTEAAAASDDLDTISGATSGKLLFLRTVADARDVVLKHNTGNIYNPALQDITLGKTQDIVFLRYDAALVKWVVIAYQNANTLTTSQLTSKAPDAIVSFNGAGTPAFIQNIGGTSIVDNGTGDYTVNISSVTTSSIVQLTMVTGGTDRMYGLQTQTAGAVRTYTKQDDGAAYDPTLVSIAVWNVK